MWPWAGVYAAQVVVAMVVWNLVNPRGGGLNAAAIAGLIFAVPMVALLRARGRFQTAASVENV
jgi:membrane associated rhomboid family serine protease